MIFSFAWKELTRRKSRTALTILSIFFSIALLVSVLAIIDFFKDAMRVPFVASGTDVVVDTFVEPGPWTNVRLSRHCGALPGDVIKQIKEELPEVEDVSGVLHFWSWYDPEQTIVKGKLINVAGIDPKKLTESTCCPLAKQNKMINTVNIEGRLLNDDDTNAVILDKRYAELKGHEKKIGDYIFIGGDKFEVVGIANMMNIVRIAQAEAFIPLKRAQELVKKSHNIKYNDTVNMLLIKMAPGKDPKAIESKIRNIIAKSATVEPDSQIKYFTNESIVPEVTGATPMMQQLFEIIAIILLVGVTLLVVKAGLISVSERTAEIGLMKATGWQDSQVTKLITIEMALQGFIPKCRPV